MKKVSLDGLNSEYKTKGYSTYSLIKNRKGNFIGKFVTTGVGMDEHKRRFNAVFKKTIKK